MPESAELIKNGSFEELTSGTHVMPIAWTGTKLGRRILAATDQDRAPEAEEARQSCFVTTEDPRSGAHCVVMRRTGGSEEFFSWKQEKITLEPGGLYRLRFQVKADPLVRDLVGVLLSASGPEGPAWFLKPVLIDEVARWQPVEILFRAQSGFNPLSQIDLEFRMYQWRRNRPDDKTPQRVWVDGVSLKPMQQGEWASARVVRWLTAPNRAEIRFADMELGLGDGVFADGQSIEFYRDGEKLKRVAFIEDLSGPDTFAYSVRSRRVYMNRRGAYGKGEVRFSARVCTGGCAYLNVAASDAGKALREGQKETRLIPLEIQEPGGVSRVNWPVTQGLPFPRGAAADEGEIRVLNPEGAEIPAQVRAASFWEDDSIRWALLDFNVDVKAGEKVVYTVECGRGVNRAQVGNPIRVTEGTDVIQVDAGALKFKVSKKNFHLFENMEPAGLKPPLSGPPSLRMIEDTGKEFAAHVEKPYTVTVEENGPMRTVIAVMGWHANEQGERFLTYTARIHAYRGQKFVRVFHTLTNRHAQNVMGKHKIAEDGWPKEESGYGYKEYPQRNIADAAILLPLAQAAGSVKGVILGADGSQFEGELGSAPMVHRQGQRTSGTLTLAGGQEETGGLPGVASLTSGDSVVTAAVYNYARLFPKEIRLSRNGLELGLIPFSKTEPHGLLKGTARTTEMMFAFTPSNSAEHVALAKAFLSPVVFSNPEWYCASKGFLNDELVPCNPLTVGAYDEIVAAFLEEIQQPLGPGVDDCGLMNYGDFPYGAYNRWVNLEYDGDLGLYMQFARSGNRAAYLFGEDASRHFMDSDTGWYTGDFETHGANFPHEYLHYSPHGPSGHTYTAGLMYYYLLTGDRRALEASRMNADACHRNMYFRVKAWGSEYDKDAPVAAPRRQFVNDRHRSDPARYPLHTYQATGEPRFLETTLAIAEELVKMPKGWLGHDDMYIHYRWPLVLDDLVEVTGRDDLKQMLFDCADWTLKDPYAKFGEYRAAQNYSGYPSSGNNARMMFQTIYAYKWTGERKYLDWMLNMYDQEMFKSGDLGGKGFGKLGDNPARALAFVVPNRTVRIDVSPARFQLIPPGKGVWKIAVRNTSETPLRTNIQIGPLPPGVKMETSRKFNLDLREEKQFEFPVEFTEEIASGRAIVSYGVFTQGTENHQGERHGFFAVHALRPLKGKLPRLLFHAPLDDVSPALAAGKNGTPIVEHPVFIPGKIGKAMGPDVGAISFDSARNIRSEQGTMSVWVRVPEKPRDDELLKIWGHGNWLIGLKGQSLVFTGQSFPVSFAKPTGDRWHHVAVAWDLEKIVFYVDGEPVLVRSGKSGKEAGYLVRDTFDLPSGRFQLFSQPGFALDDLRIYSVPLSADEVRALCENPALPTSAL